LAFGIGGCLHAQAHQRVECGEGLVHVQDFGLYDEGTRNLDAL